MTHSKQPSALGRDAGLALFSLWGCLWPRFPHSEHSCSTRPNSPILIGARKLGFAILYEMSSVLNIKHKLLPMPVPWGSSLLPSLLLTHQSILKPVTLFSCCSSTLLKTHFFTGPLYLTSHDFCLKCSFSSILLKSYFLNFSVGVHGCHGTCVEGRVKLLPHGA